MEAYLHFDSRADDERAVYGLRSAGIPPGRFWRLEQRMRVESAFLY